MPIYSSTGAFNVAVNNTTGTGRYSASGALRINLVTGSSYVGLYAADGALNVVDVSGVAVSAYGGLYHPSGAIRGRTAPTTYSGLQAPDGSYYFQDLSSPLNLFANGEQGVWYDPSDFSTLFQDKAGTTPVTAVEQSVGLILDKSKGLVLGSELLTNGDFSNGTTSWVASGSTLTTDTGRLKITATSTYGFAYQALTTVIGRTYKLTYSITNGDATACYMYVDTAAGLNAANFDSGAKADGTYSAVFVATATTTYVKPFIAGAGKFAFYDNISARELPGNHASQSTLASRPVLRQEATGQYYLAFDGTDDSLATGSIDFSATDKMSVFAGVRKLSDSSGHLIAELGNVSAGGWYLLPGNYISNSSTFFTFLGRGSAGENINQAVQASGYAAPLTAVLSATGNISGDVNTLRVNKVAAANATGDQGTGNYGNLPLNIGRRNNTSLPFNGRLYSLIVRGALSTDAQIASTETWVNGKTGAY